MLGKPMRGAQRARATRSLAQRTAVRWQNAIARTRVAMRMLPIVLTAVACHRGAGRSGAPMLEHLTPDRGDVSRGAVVEVLVQGQGFDSVNTVLFGAVTLRQVRRVSPTTLRFTVPLDDAQRVGRGEAPPIALSAGVYPVRIATARGTSNTLSFTLERVGGAR